MFQGKAYEGLTCNVMEWLDSFGAGAVVNDKGEREFLDDAQRSFAIGVWVAAFSAGGILGPLFGGLLLEHFWWGSVFLIAVPVMVLLLVLGPVLLPEFRDEHAGRLDLASALMATSAVLAMIYGMKRLAEGGFALAPLAIIAVGAAVAWAFLRRQRGLADPMIDVRLFAIPSFGAALATNVITLFVAFGFFLFIAQYFQLVLGLSPLLGIDTWLETQPPPRRVVLDRTRLGRGDLLHNPVALDPEHAVPIDATAIVGRDGIDVEADRRRSEPGADAAQLRQRLAS